MDEFIIWGLFGLIAIVGALLLHSLMKIQQLAYQPPPLWLYGFHEDGTPIKGWHELKRNKNG